MARARMRWHGGRRTGHWYYIVESMVNGERVVVFCDGTGNDPRKIPPGLFRQAERDAAVVTRMEAVGHEFAKSFGRLVDEAAEEE